MLNGRKLVLDTFCEVYDLMKPWADAEFWDLSTHEVIPNSIYLIGRQQCKDNMQKLKDMAERGDCLPIMSNPAEGSDTLRWQVRMMDIEQLVLEGKILLIGGGNMEPKYPNLWHDAFMTKILDYDENRSAAMLWEEIFRKQQKPYKFLFLNGRARPHRKYLIERFRRSGLLDQSLWTCLEGKGFNSRILSLVEDGVNLMLEDRPIKYLPENYEVHMFQDRLSLPVPENTQFVKFHLFDNLWGDIYLRPEPYIDTYFSLVTETIYDYPYSFRTEKIWKPIAMGHPWIAVTNAGFYRDIRNMGFLTFDSVIDESFDQIDDNQHRIERITQVVEDLCRQDLDAFLASVRDVCKYNQQHLSEMIPRIRRDFPVRLLDFVQKYTNE